jgi:addiction module RelE/StbE family toxin
MKLIWTDEALEKLDSIEQFIAQDSPARAQEFIDFLIKSGESIANNPESGRIVPEIANQAIREIIVRKYRIVYRIKDNTIEIITVFEGHMLLKHEEIEID